MLLGCIVIGGIVAATRGDDDEARGPKPTTTTTKPVSSAGKELLARLAKGRDGNLHLRLDSDPAQVEKTGSKVTVELWRSGDLVRQDLKVEGGGQVRELSAFQLTNGTFLCQKSDTTDWECAATRSTATESGEPAGLIEAAAANLAGADVATTEETINGQAVRCYAIKGGTEADSTMCVTADGIPLRFGVEGQQLTAAVVDHTVDSKQFELPAKVAPLAQPSSTTSTTAAKS